MPKDIFQTALTLQKKFNLNHLAEQWDENSDCIHKAFSQATALVIKTLSNHLEKTPDIEDNVTDLAANMQNLTANEGSQEILGTKNSGMMQTGKNLLSLLFSTNLENVYATLAKNTGLKAVNAAPLMSLAASSVLGAFEQQSQQTNLSLTSIIAQQDDSYFSHLPEEAAKTNFTQESTSIEPPPAQSFNKKSMNSSWWWLLPLCILLVSVYWYLTRPTLPVDERIARLSVDSSQHAQKTTSTDQTQQTLGEGLLQGVIRQTLPGGNVLTLPETSTEAKLLAFIKDPAQTPDKAVWFDLNHLTANNELNIASQTQLNNIAIILAAYPNIKLKIREYSDNTKDPENNKIASKTSAQDVMNALINRGISQNRLTAEDHDETQPISNDGTVEEGIQNRRVALNVTEK
ncbi:putative peptidoglycan-associated (lipo)protein [Candidatus Regiella insecticola 5.15]|uniref:Putative peptidoglycan-associated (Lipo)protein n=1 Tax=Candidatus Regiella insecticola 5.15 TaxID=1005043 RepID=G2GZ53_9ENTR|nr:OmpA family protein [Candidatus Regiella insecticola]EGY28983.1 putative peptidoglycan-associated (lipo)protein [Candidatus Regiella insecticola 5.15]